MTILTIPSPHLGTTNSNLHFMNNYATTTWSSNKPLMCHTLRQALCCTVKDMMGNMLFMFLGRDIRRAPGIIIQGTKCKMQSEGSGL